ncbi:MAG: hypothetical protein ACYSWP_23915 [Planctomycetota bacterium]|jgi:hypothetical protein
MGQNWGKTPKDWLRNISYLATNTGKIYFETKNVQQKRDIEESFYETIIIQIQPRLEELSVRIISHPGNKFWTTPRLDDNIGQKGKLIIHPNTHRFRKSIFFFNEIAYMNGFCGAVANLKYENGEESFALLEEIEPI